GGCQNFYEAFRRRRLRRARCHRGGVGDGTLQIARQRSQQLDALRGCDERDRTRRHVVSFALQHRLENVERSRAHDLGLEHFGYSQPLENLGEGLSRLDAVENDEVGTEQSILKFFHARYVMRGTVFAVAKANADMTDHRPIPGAHFTRIGQLLDKVRLDDNDVGDLAVFDLLFYDRPGVAR